LLSLFWILGHADRVIKAIGDGTYGSVLKAVNSKGDVVAIKKMKVCCALLGQPAEFCSVCPVDRKSSFRGKR
jgi:hypothetical protein